MPSFSNDIPDTPIGGDIAVNELQIATNEGANNLVPVLLYGYVGNPDIHIAASVIGQLQITIQRSIGQDIIHVYDDVALAIDENSMPQTWSGIAVDIDPDVTKVTRVNFQWTQN